VILVIAGTKDGRDLITLLAKEYPVMASVFSDYGRDLLKLDNLSIHTGPLDSEGLTELIANHNITLVVDASHPYAVNVSKNTMQACKNSQISYLRYERPCATMPVYEKLYVVNDYLQAIERSASLGKVIFLTTGSRHLRLFKVAEGLQNHRLIARILPEANVLTECLELGFSPQDIIALQGPFSHELNKALFKDYQAEVIVTKNSGQIGGCDTKITAAMDLGLPIVLIDRPKIDYSQIVYGIEDVIQFVKEAQNHEIYNRTNDH